jgi:hypothetical protein
MLRAFAAQATRREYEYVPAREYDKVADQRSRNQIYWREILYRAHLGASASLMRLHHWLTGTIRAAADGNPLLTASGMSDVRHATRRRPILTGWGIVPARILR